MHGLERMPLFRAVALVAAASVLLVHAAHAQGAYPSAVIARYEDAWGSRNSRMRRPFGPGTGARFVLGNLTNSLTPP